MARSTYIYVLASSMGLYESPLLLGAFTVKHEMLGVAKGLIRTGEEVLEDLYYYRFSDGRISAERLLIKLTEEDVR